MDLGMFSCMKVWIWGCLVVRRYGFVECFSCTEVCVWGG